MYKIRSTHFVENKVGATLVASLTNSTGDITCITIHIVNPEDSENIGQRIDASASLRKLASDFKDAINLKRDIEITIDEENHEITVTNNNGTLKIKPSSFNIY